MEEDIIKRCQCLGYIMLGQLFLSHWWAQGALGLVEVLQSPKGKGRAGSAGSLLPLSYILGQENL